MASIVVTTNLSGWISANVSAGTVLAQDSDITTAVPIENYDELHLAVGATRVNVQASISSGTPTAPTITFCFWTSLVVPPPSVNQQQGGVVDDFVPPTIAPSVGAAIGSWIAIGNVTINGTGGPTNPYTFPSATGIVLAPASNAPFLKSLRFSSILSGGGSGWVGNFIYNGTFSISGIARRKSF